MSEYITTLPEKSAAAERAHSKLARYFGNTYASQHRRYPALVLDTGATITPELVCALLDLLNECEGCLDPEWNDGQPDALPSPVVDAMLHAYRALERA